MKKKEKCLCCSSGHVIFSVDLVLDLLIGRHLILFSFSEIHQKCNGNTDCKSGRGDSVHFSSPVGLSLGLVVV